MWSAVPEVCSPQLLSAGIQGSLGTLGSWGSSRARWRGTLVWSVFFVRGCVVGSFSLASLAERQEEELPGSFRRLSPGLGMAVLQEDWTALFGAFSLAGSSFDAEHTTSTYRIVRKQPL